MTEAGHVEVRIQPWLERAWELFSQQWIAFAAAFVVFWLVTTVGTGIIIGLFIAPAIVFGAMEMAFRAARGETVEFGDIFSGFQRYLESLIFFLVYGVLASIAFALFFIPGLIFTFLTMLALPIAVGQGVGPIDAMGRSYNLVKQSFGGFALLWLLEMALFLGTVPLGGLPILVTGPVAYLLLALAYEDLTDAAVRTEPGIEVQLRQS